MFYIRCNFGLLAAVAFLGAAVSSNAQLRSGGYIDTSFGAPCLSNAGVNFLTRALVVQPNGKILAGGNYLTASSCVNAIARLQTNGALDTTFLAPFLTQDLVNSIALQGDGKIVVGGVMGGVGTGGNLYAVARLNANGSLDTTFARILPGAAVQVNAVALQPDGKVIAAGVNYSVQPNFFGVIRRLSANGTNDPTFAPGTTDYSPTGQGISAVALQSGKIILAGSFTAYTDGSTSLNRSGIARLNGNGTIDVAFNPLLGDAAIYALLVQPDGKILVAGSFDVSGLQQRCVARLQSDGTIDPTFAPGYADGTLGLSLALQPDGKILLGHSYGIVRLLTNGVIDTTFGPLNAPGSFGTAAQTATAVARTMDDKVLVGATSVTVGDASRRSVTRLWGDIPAPPFIVQQPATQIVPAGTNVTFSVIATGAPPIVFQWRKNNANIKGANDSSLLLTNVNSTHTANYTVIASNLGGAVTSAVARLMVQFQVAALTIVTNGVGVVTPNLTKGELEIGRAYSVTAKPAVGNLFSNWTGGVTSSSPALTFVMQSNLVLVVNFVPNPFIPVKGSYNGLFYDTNSPALENAGGITLTLNDRGGFNGSVKRGAKARKFSGAFSLERTATVTIPATTTEPVMTLTLEIDTMNGVVTGSAAFGANHAAVTAYRNPFSSTQNPAPTSGNYNSLFPGVADTAVAPGGDGYLALAISTSGRVSGKGTLADGSVLNLVTGTSSNAQVPVYLAPYSGRGSIFGWLTASNTTGNDVSGTLWWTKPGTVGGTFYPLGFTNEVEVVGSRYVAPASGTPVLVLTNGVVILSGGNLANWITNSITLGADNKITGDNKLTITISRTKGSVTGSFVDPASGKKRNLKGVALLKQNQAGGFFLGTDESGLLFIGEAEE